MLNKKPTLPPNAPIAVILFSGGGGIETGMVEAGIRPFIAVECDPEKPKLSSAIADNHDRNFSEYGCRLIRQTVQEVAAAGFPGFPHAPDYLHASPVCSNFSNAKSDRIESTCDIDCAIAVGDAIKHLQPKNFTLENVPAYKKSESFQIILGALEAEYYEVDWDIVNLADYGLPQARERLILRASKVRASKGVPIPLPPKTAHVGWFEAIAHLIPTMTASQLLPDQQKALSKFLETNEPTPLLINRVGARRKQSRCKPGHLPCDTIMRSHFTDGKGSNRNKFADIWLPDGTNVRSLSIEAAAILQGFPDWYEFPADTATAGSIIGYSVPPSFGRQLFQSAENQLPIDNPQLTTTKSKESKETDKWYTPPNIQDLIIQTLGEIDLDPCADDGHHIKARSHYTVTDDGLNREWEGRVFMNPPYSCPGVWMTKLQAEIEAGRVSEAIALVPASTDTTWLSPVLATQPVCFWKGRIKFLDTDYQPKLSARQSHVLVYWGTRSQQFKEVFQEHGIVMYANTDRWDAADFGEVARKADGDQMTIFYDNSAEPPAPDDFATIADYERAWSEWESANEESINNYQLPEKAEEKIMATFQFSTTQQITEQIAQLQAQLNQLTDTLKPYQEYEESAEELRLQVAEYGSKMSKAGIPQSEVLKWAKALYASVSGMEFIESNNSVVAAQNEVIAQLKNDLAIAKCAVGIANSERDKATLLLETAIPIAQERAEEIRDERLKLMADLTSAIAERDEAIAVKMNESIRAVEKIMKLEDENAELKSLSQQTDASTIEVLQKENASLITKIEKLELAELKTQSVIGTEELDANDLELTDDAPIPQQDHNFQLSDTFGLPSDDHVEVTNVEQGLVVGIHGNAIAPDKDKHPDIKSQGRADKFLASVRSKGRVNSVVWQDISEACQGDRDTLKEIHLQATTKYQKDLIEKLPTLMADHITETGDITDMQWVGNHFKSKVEALLEVKKSLPYHSKDSVRCVETGEIWEVKSFDGAWLSLTQGNRVTSLHESEVEPTAVEVAA
jgi:DNA (cytosine-5)-methyltransferase 1